jgi:hypothetical protein
MNHIPIHGPLNGPPDIENLELYSSDLHPVEVIEPNGLPVECEAADALRQLLMFVCEANSTEERGYRATIVLWLLRPAFFNAFSMEEIGAQTNRRKQAVSKTVASIRSLIGGDF